MKKWLVVLVVLIVLITLGIVLLNIVKNSGNNSNIPSGTDVGQVNNGVTSELDALANEAASAISSAKNAEASAPEFEGDLSAT